MDQYQKLLVVLDTLDKAGGQLRMRWFYDVVERHMEQEQIENTQWQAILRADVNRFGVEAGLVAQVPGRKEWSITPRGRKVLSEMREASPGGELQLDSARIKRAIEALGHSSDARPTQVPEPELPAPAWFVGGTFGGKDDQTQRFIAEGIWEQHFESNEKLEAQVRQMEAGDRIAIKATYTRKHNLPFDNHGKVVSVMAVKAIGTILENPGDGRRVRVDWTPVEPAREWYFYTIRHTVWRVEAENPFADDLLAFAFDNKPQDLGLWLNHPFWRERYGSPNSGDSRFAWVPFFEAVAEKLLQFRGDRTPLMAAIHALGSTVPKFQILNDKFPDGTEGPLQDICPFTAMGIFNRQMTPENRRAIAGELAKFLGVDIPVPDSFEGVPLLNNQNSWFFSYAYRRGAQDIDHLWELFAAAERLVEDESPEARARFVAAWDGALQGRGVRWNISWGLFWAHPRDFLSLDSHSRQHLQAQLHLDLGPGGAHTPVGGQQYLDLLDEVRSRFELDDCPVKSFPELALEAWRASQGQPSPEDEELAETLEAPSAARPYGIADILADGCFLDAETLERILARLRSKKNIILQGPPGTGKTWLARRMAHALVGHKDDTRLRAVQFHPNLSYEDFVRGWRPSEGGKLTLVDGVFLSAIRLAQASPSTPFVVVIEEINRGNPAQIFGELLTLLEAGKRRPEEALELCYNDAHEAPSPVYIPDNLYVIGTMNVADRSLALVDFALRRRFAFIDLEPRLGPAWRGWVVERCGLEAPLAFDIERRIGALNQHIAESPRLGPQFRVGHSYVTPSFPLAAGETRTWFRDVVHTELLPLLEEYWFDAPEEARQAAHRLLEGW